MINVGGSVALPVSSQGYLDYIEVYDFSIIISQIHGYIEEWWWHINNLVMVD